MIKTVLFLSCFWVLAIVLFAHPHVWNIANPVFVFDQQGLKTISIEMIWDEMFSEQVISEIDQNKDSLFDTAEMSNLRKAYFDNLQSYQYLAVIKINGKPIPQKLSAEHFTASIDRENRLVYKFDLPLRCAFGQSISFAFEDPTNYMAYETTQKTVQIKGRKALLKKAIIDQDYCRFSFTILNP